LRLHIPSRLLGEIRNHGEECYPEEGAGFLLGRDQGARRAERIIVVQNERAPGDRRTRYLIDPVTYMQAELTAQDDGLEVIGVFHSHPDHPNQPSEYDRDWAQPGFSYVITSVERGKAAGSRSWRLTEDRSGFDEEELLTDDHP
jgi:proteasome lid subunit RPN8/RPN11